MPEGEPVAVLVVIHRRESLSRHQRVRRETGRDRVPVIVFRGIEGRGRVVEIGLEDRQVVHDDHAVVHQRLKHLDEIGAPADVFVSADDVVRHVRDLRREEIQPAVLGQLRAVAVEDPGEGDHRVCGVSEERFARAVGALEPERDVVHVFGDGGGLRGLDRGGALSAELGALLLQQLLEGGLLLLALIPEPIVLHHAGGRAVVRDGNEPHHAVVEGRGAVAEGEGVGEIALKAAHEAAVRHARHGKRGESGEHAVLGFGEPLALVGGEQLRRAADEQREQAQIDTDE